ncbi:hypothetical protein V8C86DRAFT_2781648 [Haematococcus lacustris]
MQPLLRLDSKCRHEAEDIKAAASRFDLEIVFSLTMPGRGLTSITSLAPCINLTDLSLPDNKIAKLEGLEPLTQLRRLNLARNQISKLEGLWHLNHLECLRLEGNRLEQVTSLSLKQLAELPALRIFYLQNIDLSCCNPCCKLPGYKAAVLKALPMLQNLDGVRSPLTSRYAQYAAEMAQHLACPPPPHEFTVPALAPWLNTELVQQGDEASQVHEDPVLVAATASLVVKQLDECVMLMHVLSEETAKAQRSIAGST